MLFSLGDFRFIDCLNIFVRKNVYVITRKIYEVEKQKMCNNNIFILFLQ